MAPNSGGWWDAVGGDEDRLARRRSNGTNNKNPSRKPSFELRAITRSTPAIVVDGATPSHADSAFSPGDSDLV